MKPRPGIPLESRDTSTRYLAAGLGGLSWVDSCPHCPPALGRWQEPVGGGAEQGRGLGSPSSKAQQRQPGCGL